MSDYKIYVEYSLQDHFKAEVLPYFYKYVPPRNLHEIDADFKACEARIQALLEEVAE